MLAWSIGVFASMPEIAEIVVITELDWIEDVAALAAGCAVVPGGPTRQASVLQGLKALEGRVDAVMVHDGARPLITARDVRKGMEPVRAGSASLLAVGVVDTIKAADARSGRVLHTLDRATLWAAQTPQFAMLGELRAAHEAGIRDGIDATDDAMLLERAGVPVHIVPGSPENFKVTLPEDLARAQALMQMRRSCE